MIPRRITLKGFLCYRDEQTIVLDDADLWVFSGRNGSGKSSIFDAMTFALFGAHRGGQSNYRKLINTASDGFEVAFEFDLEGSTYRIRRSLRRVGATSVERQLFRREILPTGEESWPAVPETNTDSGLNAWLQAHLGLTYETFTSSVLLVQGQAEKLLGASEKERHAVLAGVFDLARYERLSKRADDRRGHLKHKAGYLREQVRAQPLIEESAIDEAGRLVEESETNLAATRAERERLVELSLRAETWVDLNRQRCESQSQEERARCILADAEAVDRDLDRLRELETVLPHLIVSVERREQLRKVSESIAESETNRERLRGELRAIHALVEETEAHRAGLIEEIVGDERRRREIVERLAALAVPLEQARRADTLRRTLRDLEAKLADFPSIEDVERLEAERSRRNGWRNALTPLESLADHRNRLVDVRKNGGSARSELDEAEAEASRLSALWETRSAESVAARDAARNARDRAASAGALWGQAEDRLARFETLAGTPACDRCGQLLTPAHFAAESERLRQEAAEARRCAEEAASVRDQAEAIRVAAEASEREAKNRLEKVRRSADTHRNRLVQAERDLAQCAEQCAWSYGRLPESFRFEVAPTPPSDWLTTTFPTTHDLYEARSQADGLEALELRLAEAQRRCEERRKIDIRLEETHRSLSEIGIDEAAGSALAREQSELQTERNALDRCLKGHEAEKAQTEETLSGLVAQREGLSRRITVADASLEADWARVETLHSGRQQARAAILQPWHEAFDSATEDDLAGWRDESRALKDRGVEERAAEIPHAEAQLKTARTRLEELDRQLDTIPIEAQCGPEHVRSRVAEADDRLRIAEERKDRARSHRDELKRNQERRQELEAQTLAAERELAVAEKLAVLLGRSGLQRYLVGDAERAILACANPILHEISGDELELRLAGEGDSEKALQLEVLVRTHGRTQIVEPIYLSGSQKFRVAVSLALGIGQYASGLHRPIASVIIDEGFGCLDRQGRQEMIGQLAALQGKLARIILVSHQEEFAEFFRNGYRFEVIDGATVAARFQN